MLEQQYDSTKFYLYAINTLLQTINELPLTNDTEVDELIEAQIAASVIIETKKEVLSSGWDFNTDKNYTLSPNIDGFINIPANILDISSKDGDLIMRGWKLYSKKAQSDKFDKPQTVDIIWDTAFNDLTHPLRNYITVRAARKFQARLVMDTNMYSYTEKDENDAFLIARRSEGNTGRYNMLTSAYGQENIVIG